MQWRLGQMLRLLFVLLVQIGVFYSTCIWFQVISSVVLCIYAGIMGMQVFLFCGLCCLLNACDPLWKRFNSLCCVFVLDVATALRSFHTHGILCGFTQAEPTFTPLWCSNFIQNLTYRLNVVSRGFSCLWVGMLLHIYAHNHVKANWRNKDFQNWYQFREQKKTKQSSTNEQFCRSWMLYPNFNSLWQKVFFIDLGLDGNKKPNVNFTLMENLRFNMGLGFTTIQTLLNMNSIDDFMNFMLEVHLRFIFFTKPLTLLYLHPSFNTKEFLKQWKGKVS
jgi:hypothetical protein